MLIRSIRLLSIFGLVALIISSVLFAYADRADIIALEGDVKIMPAKKNQWMNAGIGMVLRPGDKIRVGKASRCDLAFDYKMKNTVGILENSEVIILLKGAEKLEILDAYLYAQLSDVSKKSVFEIKTPTAVCGARGTGLGVKGNKAGTQATAFKNSIYVKNNQGEEKDIKEGFERSIDASGKISDGIAAKLENIQKFNSWSGNIDKISKAERRTRDVRKSSLTKNLEKSVDMTEKLVEKSDKKTIDDRESKVAETRSDDQTPNLTHE